jgi:hypothetical protein
MYQENGMRFLITALVLVLFSTPVLAGDPCNHPIFIPSGCGVGPEGPPGPVGPAGQDGEDGADGRDGIDGQDGRDGIDGQDGADGRDGIDGRDGRDGIDGIDGINGIDGIDGRDGIDGINGIDGRDGRDGRDGVVPTAWINEVRYNHQRLARYTAASQAVQIYLPQDQYSRVTIGVSKVSSYLGLGIGYAYKNDDGVAFTLGLGNSGSESMGKASVGFEFGGSKDTFSAADYKAELQCAYVGGELTLTNECVLKK